MAKYARTARELLEGFDFDLERIPGEENDRVDALAKLASAKAVVNNRTIIQETLHALCIEEVMCLRADLSWMMPIVQFLKLGELLSNKLEARKVECRSAYFFIENDRLYKKGFALPSLRCLNPEEADYVLREIHEGICGSHLTGTSVALKAVRSGYYWPKMKQDALQLVQNCDKCQWFARVQRQPLAEQKPITSPWPFDQWGIDLLGPFPTALDQLKFMVVAVDYFTKWIEVEPLATITSNNIQKFVWKSIICR